MIRILTSIVLFNPDLKQLELCLRNIIPYVEHIHFIDNASNNASDISSFITSIPNASITWNKENFGLSKAFNFLVSKAREKDYSHLLLLDQDSIPSENFITEYKKNICDDFACIVPLLIHKSKEYQKAIGAKPIGEIEKVNDSINSGTLINLKVIPLNTLFNEIYFIDWIDIDFFHKLKKMKKQVIRVNKATLLVNIGHQRVHHVLHYTWFSAGYSAFRLRKQAQDTIHFFFENRDHEFLKGHIIFVLWKWLMMLFFEPEKIKKSIAIFSGLINGLKQHFKKKINL